MIKEYTLNPLHLLACLPHVDESHKNNSLRHVYIGDGYICASNGHTMLMIDDESVKGCDYLIPTIALRELDDALDRATDIGFKLFVYNEKLAAFGMPGCPDINFELSQLKRINYKKADIAKPSQFINERPVFNPRLLMLFQVSFEYLTGCSDMGVCLHTQGLTDSAYVEMFDDVHGVIKPMYVSKSPELIVEAVQ